MSCHSNIRYNAYLMAAAFALLITHEEYIRAAPDSGLSSSESHLLKTLLSEEDQSQYNEIINTTLSHHTLHILHQLSSLLHLSPSITWTSIILLKKLILLQHNIDLLTVIASITLSSKYQNSQPYHIDYEFIADCCQIQNIQLIHTAEIELLDILSYDVCVTTPDHFFSYLSNLTSDDHTAKQIIEQARSLFSIISLSHQTLELLSKYPSSIVTLSLLLHIPTSNDLIIKEVKSFLFHKKDRLHYRKQLLHCTAQLQSLLTP